MCSTARLSSSSTHSESEAWSLANLEVCTISPPTAKAISTPLRSRMGAGCRSLSSPAPSPQGDRRARVFGGGLARTTLVGRPLSQPDAKLGAFPRGEGEASARSQVGDRPSRPHDASTRVLDGAHHKVRQFVSDSEPE